MKDNNCIKDIKQNLHFVHGNGFTSGCYTQMLKYLEQDFNCYSLDKVGHNEDFPISDNWEYLVDEVINNIIKHEIAPVIAVGHSLGGALSLLAAIKAPEYFTSVVLLDAPVLSRMKSIIIKLFKKIGLIDKITPAGKTKNRRQYWSTKEEVISYLKHKTLFKDFTSQCLDDYINYGLEKNAQGYSLKFDKAKEYHIFRTIPHILPNLKGKLKVRTALLYGDKSNVVHYMDKIYMQRHFNILLQKVPGSHMFPMEHPEDSARAIIKTIEKLAMEQYKNGVGL